MRILKGERRDYSITEKDYNRLLTRFDLGKAKKLEKESVRGFIIEEPCLCNWYSCDDCPLEDCDGILRANKLLPDNCSLGAFSIIWSKEHDTGALREIQAIRDYLLNLKRVSRYDISKGGS